MFNLAYSWLFSILLPSAVLLNMIDMLKTRGMSGLWNCYTSACGMTDNRMKFFKKHHGNIVSKSDLYNPYHDPIVGEAILHMRWFLNPGWSINATQYKGNFKDFFELWQ